MSILISILLVVEVLAAFLLVVVILAQKSKDQGLGMAFGSGMGESLFGSRAGNVLTRLTIILAAVFMLTTMLLGVLFARGQTGGSGSVMDRADREVPVAPVAAPAAAPAAPLLPEEAPVAAPPADTASEPVTLQMGADGNLAPVAAPAAEAVPVEAAPAEAAPAEAAPAEAPAAEAAPAP